MCEIAVFKSNQCEKRNPVHQRFDVRNQDGAGDTSFFQIQLKTKTKTKKQKKGLSSKFERFFC